MIENHNTDFDQQSSAYSLPRYNFSLMFCLAIQSSLNLQNEPFKTSFKKRYLHYYDKKGVITDSLKEIRKLLLSNRANSCIQKEITDMFK